VAAFAPAIPAARGQRGSRPASHNQEDSRMAIMDDKTVSMSGLSEPEAKEFHKIFMTSFIAFTVVAVVAHFLVWQWRPWLPGPRGYNTQSMLDGAGTVFHHITTLLT